MARKKKEEFKCSLCKKPQKELLTFGCCVVYNSYILDDCWMCEKCFGKEKKRIDKLLRKKGNV